jgi:uncharacterized membrane protein YfcA
LDDKKLVGLLLAYTGQALKRFVYMLLVIGVGVLLVTSLIKVPQHQVELLKKQVYAQKTNPLSPSSQITPLDIFNAEDRSRQTLATMVGGFLVLVGAYMTWRNVRAAERNTKIAEDKQLTDRFTAAVTNLSSEGPEKIALRLGGIYALERIARDSPNDH